MTQKHCDALGSLKGRTILISIRSESGKYARFAHAASLKVSCVTHPELVSSHTETCAYDYVLLEIKADRAQDFPSDPAVIAIKNLRERYPLTAILALNSRPFPAFSKLALEAGANHCIQDPLNSQEDFQTALTYAQQHQSKNFVSDLKNDDEIFRKYPEGIVIGHELRKMMTRLAQKSTIPINLLGETGTGKEELVKLYHSLRCKLSGPMPLVVVNCAQLNPSIADSELFGHRKGAFTGAVENSLGYIGEAHGGILFLDEIHCLDLKVQAKLLRVLNDGSYVRMGEAANRKADFQLITASTLDLDDEVQERRFLLDLKMRIDGYPIHLKPLRERSEDIPDLLALVLARHKVKISTTKLKEIASKLSELTWPGNIRQFCKTIQAWIIHCEVHELPLEYTNIPGLSSLENPGLHTKFASGGNDSIINIIRSALVHDLPLAEVIDSVEKAILSEAISRHRTIADVCRALKVARSTLDARRKELQIC